jgi:hypothetical protein
MLRFGKASSTPRGPSKKASSTPWSTASTGQRMAGATRQLAESARPTVGLSPTHEAADREFSRLSRQLTDALESLREQSDTLAGANESMIDLSGFEEQITSALVDSYQRVMEDAAKGEAARWPTLAVQQFNERLENELGTLFQFFNPFHDSLGHFAHGHGSKVSIGTGQADALGGTGGGGGGTGAAGPATTGPHPMGPAHDVKQKGDFKSKAAYTKYLVSQGYDVPSIAKHVGDSPYYVNWYATGPGSKAGTKGTAAAAGPAAATPAPTAFAKLAKAKGDLATIAGPFSISTAVNDPGGVIAKTMVSTLQDKGHGVAEIHQATGIPLSNVADHMLANTTAKSQAAAPPTPPPAPAAPPKPTQPSGDPKTAADFSSKVAYTKYLINQGYSSADIASHIGKNPYYVKYYEKEIAAKGGKTPAAANQTPAAAPSPSTGTTPVQLLKAMQDASIEFSNSQLSTAKTNPVGNTANVVVNHLHGLGHDAGSIAAATGISHAQVVDHINKPLPLGTGSPSMAMASAGLHAAQASAANLTISQKKVLADIPTGFVAKDIVSKMHAAGHAPEHIAAALGMDVNVIHTHLGTTPAAAPATTPSTGGTHASLTAAKDAYNKLPLGDKQSMGFNPDGIAAYGAVTSMHDAGHTPADIASATGLHIDTVQKHLQIQAGVAAGMAAAGLAPTPQPHTPEAVLHASLSVNNSFPPGHLSTALSSPARGGSEADRRPSPCAGI